MTSKLKKFGAIVLMALGVAVAAPAPGAWAQDGLFMAEIKPFAGNFAPQGWAFCDGQLLPIAQYNALFSLLGTIYGGDGRTTFALPDLRGRAPLHPGNGPGLSSFRLGQTGGVEQVTLNAIQIPAHQHSPVLKGATGAATVMDPAGAFLAAPAAAAYGQAGGRSGIDTTLDANAVADRIVGGSQPHANLPPYVAVNYIIAIQGIYPSRN